MNSILQPCGRYCVKCFKNGAVDPLDVHHVFNGPYRKKSEKYGLTVYLCHSSCHMDAHQRNPEYLRQLKAWAQEIAMQHYGWSTDDFIQIFGKNYIKEI